MLIFTLLIYKYVRISSPFTFVLSIHNPLFCIPFLKLLGDHFGGGTRCTGLSHTCHKMAASVELLQAGCWLVVLLVIAFLSIDFLSKKNIKYPPLIKGWIPWLGCAINFGKAPLNYIKESWQKHGAVFTFYAAGQRMTFLTDTSDFPLFFNSPQADFQRAVEEAVKNTAGINKHNFFANHRKIHDLVKGRLSSSNLQKLAPKVGRQLDGYISNGMYVIWKIKYCALRTALHGHPERVV